MPHAGKAIAAVWANLKTEQRAFLALGVVIGLAGLVIELSARPLDPVAVSEPVAWLAFVLALPSTRRWYLVGIPALTVAVVAASLVDKQPWPLLIALCAFMSCGVRRQWGPAVVLVLVVLLWIVLVWVRYPEVLLSMFGLIVPVLAGGAVIGEAWGREIRAASQAEAREAERIVAARDALVGERRRIARELHDGVARALTTIHVNASILEVADHPAQAARAREVIFAMSESALAELADYVRVLDGGVVPPRLRVEPQVEVDEVLHDEVGRLRELGHRVEVDFDLGETSPDTRALVVLLLREASANIVKHAGEKAQCHIRGFAEDGRACVEVANSLPGEPAEAGRLVSAGIGLGRLEGDFARAGGTLTYGRHGEQWQVVGELSARTWAKQALDLH